MCTIPGTKNASTTFAASFCSNAPTSPADSNAPASPRRSHAGPLATPPPPGRYRGSRPEDRDHRRRASFPPRQTVAPPEEVPRVCRSRRSRHWPPFRTAVPRWVGAYAGDRHFRRSDGKSPGHVLGGGPNNHGTGSLDLLRSPHCIAALLPAHAATSRRSNTGKATTSATAAPTAIRPYAAVTPAPIGPPSSA